MVAVGRPTDFKSHLDRLKQISDNQFGDEYIPRDKFERSIDAGGNQHLLVAVKSDDIYLYRTPHRTDSIETDGLAPVEGEVIGFCIYQIYGHNLLDNYLNIDYHEYPRVIKQSDEVGIPRSVAVSDSHQGHGIGQLIVSQVVSILEHQITGALCVVGWESPDGVRLHSVLRENGFKPADKHDDYWYSESKAEGYDCGACGSPPCRCNAVIYVRPSDCLAPIPA